MSEKKPTTKKTKRKAKKGTVTPRRGKRGPLGPRLLDEAVIKQICHYVRLGVPQKVAAMTQKIQENTYWLWRKNGKRDLNDGLDTIYAKLYVEIEKARADCVARNTEIIATAAAEDWRASAFFLERRHAEDWGKTEKLQMTGAGGGPVQIEQQNQQLQTLMKNPRVADALAVVASESASLQLQGVMPKRIGREDARRQREDDT